MNYHQALEKLNSINQSHLLKYFDQLTEVQQLHLISQIEHIDLNILKQQQLLLKNAPSQNLTEILPFPHPSSSGNDIDFIEGKEMIAQGKMGCLIAAGGQGSRLRISGPKGIFPVSPYEYKSLFQLFTEKIISAGKQAKRPLSLAIMTSPENHQETVTFFEEHRFFGIDPKLISFFSQGTLPLLDQSGNLFLKSKDTIAIGPDGNGLTLQHFFNSGIWTSWHQQGIQAVNFILIDNPLADPYDAELLGHHSRNHNDITIKCISRKDAHEKVGVLARFKEKSVIVEYSELPESLADATHEDGSLLFSYANISLFCFSMNFIKQSIEYSPSMPLHKAFKACAYLDITGTIQQSVVPNAWKFETFIFDLLPLAEKVGAILYPRDQCFSPLKNYEGKDSIATVRQAILNNDRRVFQEVTGTPAAPESSDISQDFYYPTPELRKKWSTVH